MDVWFTPENQNWLAQGLADCEVPQDVEDIRSFAPVAALKSAVKLLDENVRARVKELTKVANVKTRGSRATCLPATGPDEQLCCVLHAWRKPRLDALTANIRSCCVQTRSAS